MSNPAAREPVRRLSPTRTMVTGILMASAGVVMFVTFVVVAIATDNRFPAQGVFMVAAAILVPTGSLTFLAGLVWRLASAAQDVRAREAFLVAQMNAATTPGQALAVQVRASTVSWKRGLAIAALCSPFAALFLASSFGRYASVLVLGSFAAAAVAFVAFFGVPRRTVLSAGKSTGPAPEPPPAAVRARILDEHAELYGTAHAALRRSGGFWARGLSAWVDTNVATGSQSAHLWTWHHELLLARETAVADIAARHGWTYRPRDLRAAADGTARNSLLGTYDGVPFLAYDRIRSASHHDKDGRLTGVTLATASVVQIPFTAPFRLAVVRDSFGADVRWGHFGSAVTLESGDFNDSYNVYCLDHYRARLVLNPAVMGILVGNPGLELVLDRGLLRLTRPDELTDEPTLLTLIALAARVARSAKAADVT